VSTLVTSMQSHWDAFIDAVAVSLEKSFSRFARSRQVTLVERENNHFDVSLENGSDVQSLGTMVIGGDGGLSSEDRRAAAAIKGANVSLVLRSNRFLIRDLPLPPRASSFMEPIIRNQIDRLTPWTSDRAMFGHVVREETASTLVVTVASTDRMELEPLVTAVTALKPRALTAYVDASVVDRSPKIALSTQWRFGVIRRHTLQKLLSIALLATLIGLSIFSAYALWVKGQYDERFETAQAEIARRRASLRVVDPSKDGEVALFARKIRGPVLTIVVEELSRLMPDDTYLSEIEVDGEKVRVTGTSRGATALIGLIEKSPEFSNAVFFAPTTRGPRDAGERFHIEATIQPRGDQ
jgi:general secretion pathway protein L